MTDTELATKIDELNRDVLRIQLCWRAPIFDACARALADGLYETSDSAYNKLATAFDGWGEIFAGLAMKCYDRRDECLAKAD